MAFRSALSLGLVDGLQQLVIVQHLIGLPHPFVPPFCRWLLHAFTQLFTVLGGQRTRPIPKLFPSCLCLASLLGMFVRYIQSAAFAFAAIGQVEMRAVPLCWVAVTNAVSVTAAASGLR